MCQETPLNDSGDPFEAQVHGQGCGCGHHDEPAAIAPPEAGAGCGCRSLSPWRRLHALCGLAFGLFALSHLTTTATGLDPVRYQALATALGTIQAQLPVVSWLLLGLLSALSFSGVYLLLRAGLAYDLKRCKRGGKARYALQRWSAVALLLFLSSHLLRTLGTYETARAFATTHALVDHWSFPCLSTQPVIALILCFAASIKNCCAAFKFMTLLTLKLPLPSK